MPTTTEYVHKKAEYLCKKADDLQDAMKNKNLPGINSAFIAITTGCVEMANKIKLAAIQEAPDFRLVNRELSYMNEATVEREEEITHIHLNTLLPLRPKGRYIDEKDIINKTYIIPLTEAVAKERVLPYKEKVVIAIIHNFSPSTRLIDHDNFYIKPIIDGITSLLLPDDSPDFVSLLMDSTQADTDSTDIYIVPYTKAVFFKEICETKKTRARI